MRTWVCAAGARRQLCGRREARCDGNEGMQIGGEACYGYSVRELGRISGMQHRGQASTWGRRWCTT
jgi:hypothetical protein